MCQIFFAFHSIVYIYPVYPYIFIYAQNYTDTLTHTQIYIYRQNVRAYCILAMFVFHTSSVNAVSLHFKETQNSYKDTVYPFKSFYISILQQLLQCGLKHVIPADLPHPFATGH